MRSVRIHAHKSPWGIVVGVYRGSTGALPALSELRRQGFRRSAALCKSSSGKVSLVGGGGITRRVALWAGTLATAAAVVLGIFFLVAGSAFEPVETWLDLSLFTAGTFLTIWFLIGLLGLSIDTRLTARYERWILRDESLLLVQARKRNLVRALDAVHGVGGQPGTFVVRPERLESGRASDRSLFKERLPSDRLRDHAARLASFHTVSERRGTKPALLRRIRQNERTLDAVYRDLAEAIKLHKGISPAAEWLLDNAYLVRSLISDLGRNLPRQFYRVLPVVVDGPHTGSPRVHGLAVELVTHTDAQLDRATITAFLEAYQSVSPLTMGELWAFPLMLRLQLIEVLGELGARVYQRQHERESADFWANRLLNAARREPEDLLYTLSELAREEPRPAPHFAVRLTSHLHDEAAALLPVQGWLERKLGMSLPDLIREEQARQVANQVSVASAITSMREISLLDWKTIFESVCLVEQVLRSDPLGTYSKMDFDTRDRYRHAVECVARSSGTSELKAVREALELARGAPEAGDGRERHVGYYLVGEGKRSLESLLGAKPQLSERTFRFAQAHPAAVYLGGIVLATGGVLAAALAAAGLGGAPAPALLALGLTGLLLASEVAVQVVNSLLTRLLPPTKLPKMSFESGIPDECRTLVVVPVLLQTRQGIDADIEDLEVRFLGNLDPNLYFGLLSDFPDAPEERLPGDGEILEAAVSGIERLSARHPSGRFFLFHRERVWSESEERWMGWERKRGKLERLNRLLSGDDSLEISRLVHAGEGSLLRGISFVITLDADTQLPPGTGRRLVETLAHPLNRARLAPDASAVTQGYTIIQPRVSTSLPSANATFFSRLFTDPFGVDPYTLAVSDVYQDLALEGSYHGKGIYDVRAFHRILTGKFPESTLLSHDLLEGTHVRVGFASDIELFDCFPTTYLACSMRQHRWIRGDWQIIDWLRRRVPKGGHGREPNPLSVLSRWKILDNLRRSLVPPSAVLLLIASWLLPAPSAAVGAALAGAMLLLPVAAPFITWLTNHPWTAPLDWRELYRLLSRALFIAALLPHQAAVALDAIGRVLYRRMVSRKRFLEWETAQGAHRLAIERQRKFLLGMGLVSAGAFACAAFVALRHPEAALPAAPYLALWILSPLAAWQLSKPPARRVSLPIEEGDRRMLRRIARQTWRFFEEFVGPQSGWLPPDNYQEALQVEVAQRTSPTNIGLYFQSALSATDLGYLPADGLIERCARAMDSLEKLERHEGHFLNWYNIETREPLRPRYVSTVDSGNLLACWWAFEQGCIDMLSRPVMGPEALESLSDSLSLVRGAASKNGGTDEEVAGALSSLERLMEPPAEDLGDLIRRVRLARPAADGLVQALKRSTGPGSEGAYWAEVLARDAAAWCGVIDRYLEWAEVLAAQPDDALRALDDRAPKARREALAMAPSMAELARGQARALEFVLDRRARAAEAPSGTLEWLEDAAGALSRAGRAASEILHGAEDLFARIRRISAEVNLRFLYDADHKLFFIGYNVSERRMERSHYDLLASEARLTSFVAIARGDVPLEHWIALSRPFGSTGGRRVLLSWSGTMFEYLMPLLLQKSFENSLLDQACRLAVDRQIEYGEERGIPWGISESAFSALDSRRIYQYRAFGVSGLGLKHGLDEDLVVAPYATMLALLVAPRDAVNNLRRLESLGLLGRYGFYEAIDYTRQHEPEGERGVIVYAYMTHHQGMSLVALDNTLRGGSQRRWFHGDLRVRSTESLLFERIPVAPPVLEPFSVESSLWRLAPIIAPPTLGRFETANTPIPRTHLLSNGSYSVMVTNAGGGYSRWKDIDITRWRADTSRDAWGTFTYIRELGTGAVWPATFQPICRQGRRYVATFTADRAEFRRRDGGIETVTEIVVSPDDDAEVRRITLTNRSTQRRKLELTSYAELALISHAADRAHPAFAKMFVETEALPEHSTLLAWRRPRSPDDPAVWAAHVVAAGGLPADPFEYETDRARFLGRGRDPRNPAALSSRLSQSAGRVLDPIFSARRRVFLEPGQSAVISFVTMAADSREKVLALAEKYRYLRSSERAIEMAWTQTQIEFRYLGIHLEDSQRFQEFASHILYPNARLRPPPDRLRRNVLGQPRLWAQGISGDIPIVTVEVRDLNDKELVREMLLAHRYWRARGLKVDLVILNEEGVGYDQPLMGDLAKLIGAYSFHAGTDQPGGVFLRSVGQMPPEEVDLLLASARAALVAARGPLAQQLSIPAESPEPPPRLRVRKGDVAYPTVSLPYMKLPYFNGLGGFTPDGREYAIYLAPDSHAPAPWMNVLANPEFGAMVSESGSGFAWAGNSQANRLVPWSNDPVTDPCSEALYIRDEETGEFWTPTAQPVRDPGPYRARHGQGYTAFEHASHGIDQNLVVFVPMDDEGGAPVKVERLRLRNISPRRRRLTVTSYVEWTLGLDREETQLHISTSWDPETGALLARNPFHPEFGRQVAFSALHPAPDSFTGDRTEFLGRNGTLSHPAALERQWLSGRAYPGLDPCAALQVAINLDPGEVVEIVHLVGQCGSAEEARRMVKRYRDPQRAEEALSRTRAWWDRLLGAVEVETPELSVNFLLNRWLPYQTLACRIWGRSGFYQSGGAFGFRDQLQDVLALLYAAPEIARGHILRAASRQFVEGDVQHWWHPPSGGGVRTRCSDDLLWLPYAAARYVRVTGDAAILDDIVPFLQGRALTPEEAESYFVPDVSAEKASLFEHCRRAIEKGSTAGPHGLPLMGSGDWNDGMNRVGAGGKGESVWLAWFLIDVLKAFAALCDLKAEHALAQDCRRRAEELAGNVETHAWDGEWYLRAFFDDGSPLGSRESLEAQIDSLPQSWGVISGAASPERAEAALRSVQDHLLRESERLALLFTPPFDKSAVDPGYIKGYPPGVRENGGQYSHAAVWVAMAYARRGDGNRAVGLLRWLNPIERARTQEEVERYRVEPYVVAADIYSLPGRVGQGGWTWYTGSSGWMYRVWLEEVLGLRLEGNLLTLEPCIPSDWASYKVRLRFRSALYEITVENPERISTGVAWVEIDGESAAEKTIPIEDDGARHTVRVCMGTRSKEAVKESAGQKEQS